jgi:hypothetical protein
MAFFDNDKVEGFYGHCGVCSALFLLFYMSLYFVKRDVCRAFAYPMA